MKSRDIAFRRLHSQQIAGTAFTAVKDVVGWMGAMQAQDSAMVRWAIGVRLPGSTDLMIEEALNRGEIIRTHLLRPTWHLVSADDVHWLRQLTAPHIKASLKSRAKELELSAAVLARTNALLEKALVGGNHLTRGELVQKLNGARISTDDNRAYHILLHAELDGIVCSGNTKGKSRTYALLSERVPGSKGIARTDALGQLARRYFLSHGPATLPDFVWWSGLPVADARNALAIVKSELVSEKVGSNTYWLGDSSPGPQNNRSSVHLLPAFDEFLISYKDRSASISLLHNSKAISNNGIFHPVVVADSQVVGSWKRTIKAGKVIVETSLFQEPGKATRRLIEKAAGTYGSFLGKTAEMHWAIAE